MSKLKVWGGVRKNENGMVRVIVAASTQKEAARILGISTFVLRERWSVTGVKQEIELAIAKPGVVFCRPLDEREAPFVEYRR